MKPTDALKVFLKSFLTLVGVKNKRVLMTWQACGAQLAYKSFFFFPNGGAECGVGEFH